VAVLAALQKAGGYNDRNRVNVLDVEGVKVVSVTRGELNLILDRGERLIAVVGDLRQEDSPLERLPIREIVKALKDGKGGITTEPETMKLVKEARQSGEMFAVIQMSETYRQLSMLAPFKTLVLTTKRVGEETELRLIARGEDAEATAKVVEEFEAGRKQLLEQMKGQPDELMALIKPFADLLEGLKVDTDKGNVMIIGKLKGNASGVMLIMMLTGFRM